MALLREGGPREWGTNLARVKDYNEVVVLGLVRSSGPIGRPAIAAATGLTLQTVSNISRRLLTAGTILEDPNGGRRKRALRINPDAGYAIGIQLVRSGLAVGVVDLAGEIRAREETPIEAEEEPGTVLERLARLVDEALAGGGHRPRQDPRRRHRRARAAGPSPRQAPQRLAPAQLDQPAARGEGRGGARPQGDHRQRRHRRRARRALARHRRAARRTSSTSTWAPASAAGSCSTARPTAACAATPARSATSRSTRRARRASAAPAAASALYTSPDGLLREAAKIALEAPPNAPVANPPTTLERAGRPRRPAHPRVVEQPGAHLAKVVVDATRVLDPELIVLGGPLVPALGEPFATRDRASTRRHRRARSATAPGAPVHQRIGRGRHRRGDPRPARPLRADGAQAEPGQPAAARLRRARRRHEPRGRTHEDAGVSGRHSRQRPRSRSASRRAAAATTEAAIERQHQGPDDRVLGLQPGRHDRPGQAGHQRGDQALQAADAA